MKLVCDIDPKVPETIRISTEWRATFRLSRYTDVIRDVRIIVRPPQNSRSAARFECLVLMRMQTDQRLSVEESSPNAGEAVALAIDRAASAVGRFARRQARQSPDVRRLLSENTVNLD